MMNVIKSRACRIAAILLLIGTLTACNRQDSVRDTSDESPAPNAEDATMAEADRDRNRLWCNEHGVYEDECYICHPELAPDAEEAATTAEPQRDPNRLWCNEHGVYEDECYICHPELAPAAEEAAAAAEAERDPNRLWCNEHGVYEDECLICHPELANTGHAQLGGVPPASREGVLWCNEHDLPEMECGSCQPQLLQDLEPGKGMKLRVASPNAIFRAGVELGRPFTAEAHGTGAVLGQVSYNRNELAQVTPLAGGVLSEVLVDVGDEVEAGQVLATVNAPDIAQAKNRYLQALADQTLRNEVYAREKDLMERKISARQDYEEARAALAIGRTEVAHARQALLDLGLPAEAVDDIARAGSTNSLLPVRAPFSGTIVERNAVTGSAVEMGASLFKVADLSTMWMELSVPEGQMSALTEGSPIAANFNAFPGTAFEGELAWVAYEIDPNTRTVPARAVLANPDRRLRAGMFGRAKLTPQSDTLAGFAVPEDAVQIIEGRPVVFAQLEDGVFEARVVELGPEAQGQRVVLAGLQPDDDVVVAESYLLKSEFLKSRLGAGCADH